MNSRTIASIVVPALMKEAKASDYLQAVPFAGGAMHGLARPARGTSRLESGTVQGLTGLGGGVAGAVPGAVLGDMAALKIMDSTGSKMTKKQKLNTRLIAALAGMALGGSVGTAMGSSMGRIIAQRETMTPEDWVALSRAGQAGGFQPPAQMGG